MDLVPTVAELRVKVRAARAAGQRVGLVPTMGALHEGHLSLIRRAREECGYVVVTLFVNPTQFGPNEDLSRYPRDLEGDRAASESAGAHLLFAPPAAEVYFPDASTWVTVEGITEDLEGAVRPGHFRGVATVVAKLFNMVQADRAYFGQKDYQQLQVIRRMVRDLHIPIEIVSCPTVREPDGLAMSSRNRYLTPEQRRAARALSRALFAARDLHRSGERRAPFLLAAAQSELDREPSLQPDYLRLLHPESLTPVDTADQPVVLALAARLGPTRLIDNILLHGGDDGRE